MSESEEYITVCQLMRTHGVKGYIKAMPFTHDLTRHEKLKDVMLKKTNGEQVQLTLEDSRLANNLWLLKFKGYDTPESLTHFVNADVMIPESERLPAPEGEYSEGYTLYALTDTAPGTLRLLEGQYNTAAKSTTELPSNISSDYDFIVIIGDTTETTE